MLTAIEYTLEKSREHGMTAREQADRDPFRIIHAQMATDDMIRRGLLTFVSTDKRQNIYDVGGITVIDDCYNASPGYALGCGAHRP